MTRDVTFQPPRPHRRRLQPNRTWLLLVCLLAINAGVFAYYGDPRDRMPQHKTAVAAVSVSAAKEQPPKEQPVAVPAATALDVEAGLRTPGIVQKVATLALRPGQTIAEALVGAGVSGDQVGAVLSSLQDLVDFRRMRPDHRIKARFSAAGALLSLDILRGPADVVRASWEDGSWRAERVPVEVTTVTTLVRGEVKASLWEALVASGEDPRLAIDVADIFAWEIDFYTEVHPGDTFRVLVEKRYVDDKFIDYGTIHAAEFVSAGEQHLAFLHANDKGDATYYTEEGESLRKQLLKSPLKFAHVTSGFGRRLHPLLGYTRAHNGIDYGVPVGTPVWAVADGRVTRAGVYGDAGRFVEIRHSNGWTSQYAHLSRINVHAGQHVSQKDVVALSGNTGLSTGPHLHYGLKKDGRPVDPQRQKFERGKPLAGAELERFRQTVRVELERMRGDQLAGKPRHAALEDKSEG